MKRKILSVAFALAFVAQMLTFSPLQASAACCSLDAPHSIYNALDLNMMRSLNSCGDLYRICQRHN